MIDQTPASALRIAGSTVARIWTHPGNRNRRVAALSKYLAWQVWERTVRRPWTVDLTGGMRIRCYPHGPISSAVIYYGLADHEEMHFLLDYLRPGDTFVDVGANIGVYSLLACSVPGVSAVALEPSAQAFDKAQENFSLNHLEDRVRLIQKAAGEAEREAMLTVGLDAMNSLVDEGSTEPAEPVTVTTLDALGLEGASLVKIDVEGWEAQVLQGAAALIAAQRPALIVEVNDPAKLEQIRQASGYCCVQYHPEIRRLEASDLAGRKGRNAILVPDIDAAGARIQGNRSIQGSPPAA